MNGIKPEVNPFFLKKAMLCSILHLIVKDPLDYNKQSLINQTVYFLAPDLQPQNIFSLRFCNLFSNSQYFLNLIWKLLRYKESFQNILLPFYKNIQKNLIVLFFVYLYNTIHKHFLNQDIHYFFCLKVLHLSLIHI